MNSKGNVFGQGNRANAAIGRTLQLVVRNVGGGRPREIDRSVFGNPGKYTFCFAEDEDDPRWESYAGCLRAIYHTGHVIGVQAFLAVGQEHANVFYEAGWSKARVKEELLRLLMIPVRELVPGRAALSQLTEAEKANPDNLIPKFKNGTFNIIRAGGSAGKYSAIINSIGGRGSIEPVTREIT